MWRKVHESDLVSRLSLTEVDAFRQNDDGEHDVIAQQIAYEVAYVRGIIRSSPRGVRMSADETLLPESLVGPAMDHLRFNLLTRLELDVNESRTKAYEQANVLFEQVSKGEFVPESDSMAEAEDATKLAATPAFAMPHPERLLD